MATLRARNRKWQVQIRDAQSVPRSKTFSLKKDALNWIKEQEQFPQAPRTVPIEPSRIEPLDQIFDQILERYQTEIIPKKKSAKSEHCHLLQIRRHRIAQLQISKLTPSVVAGFRDDRLKSVSGSTVKRELGILSSLLNLARMEWGYEIQINPVTRIRKPIANRPRTRRLEDGEFEKLELAITRCKNPYVWGVFVFALATGMRRGEVLSLRWRDLNFKHQTAHLLDTKNGQPRTVPLSPKALQVLDEMRSISGISDEQRIFQISANAFRLSWERIRARAKIENLHFHDLRHEAISRFFEIGLSVPEVSLISGHKDIRMLFRYTNLRAEDIARKLNG